MGIPYFFRQIILKNQEKLLTDLHTCNRLFLDFNSIIHTSSADVLSKYKDTENLETKIFEAVFNHVIYLTTICKPKTILYLAVDGVAPRSKIHQQRKRRYLSAYTSNLINKFKDTNNIRYTKWDSNAITPGTEFMKNLHLYLQNAISKSDQTFKIILSGYDEEGEGEHKIFEYIRSEPSDDVDVIYGLDADLIMLSLCCESQEKIYLMREGQNFMNGLIDFKYLDIDKLRKSITIDYKDYVFICFFLGNDFMSNLACLKIKSEAIEILCEVYKQTYNTLKDTLIKPTNKNGYTINYDFLVMFLETLMNKEDSLMKETTNQFYGVNQPIKTYFSSKLEKFTYELDNYPNVNKFPFVINPITDTVWKTSYYHHLFGSNNNDLIKQICENYIEGLVWTMNYYFNNKFDKLWYYKYNYAPCISDIYKYLQSYSNLKTIEKTLSQTTSNVKITTDIQLLMVLPPFSKKLLKPKLQCIMDEIKNGCVHFYPIKFCLTSYMKSHLWECLPVLPNIDVQRILNAYEKVNII